MCVCATKTTTDPIYPSFLLSSGVGLSRSSLLLWAQRASLWVTPSRG